MYDLRNTRSQIIMLRLEADRLKDMSAYGSAQVEGDVQVELARRLVSRLERLSADSYWAHQASGIRGALLRALERIERNRGGSSQAALNLKKLNEAGFTILLKAAQECMPPEYR